MKKMKAIVKTKEGPGNVELMEMPVPEVKENEVKIKVDCAGICGTDVKIKHGDTWSNPPVILGHEFSGVVEEVGRLVLLLNQEIGRQSETATNPRPLRVLQHGKSTHVPRAAVYWIWNPWGICQLLCCAGGDRPQDSRRCLHGRGGLGRTLCCSCSCSNGQRAFRAHRFGNRHGPGHHLTFDSRS